MESLKITQLLEGENPYQIPAYLYQTDSNDSLALANFRQVSGIAPCFTNMADFDSILQTLCSLNEAFDNYYSKIPHIVIAAKHGNPCGLAVDWECADIAIDNALWGNPRAIWGGEVITNFTISGELAEKLLSSSKREEVLDRPQWMLDVIIAPHFDKEAVRVLDKRHERKLFQNEKLTHLYLNREQTTDRIVRGGFLRQPLPHYVLDLKVCDVDFSFPDLECVDSLIVAWAASWFSNHGGNEVAIAKEGKLLGVGGGPATIDACCTAAMRAKKCGHDLTGSVFAADAFFPFTDGPEELIKVGCVYGVVPDGGKNAELVKEYFKSSKVNVFYLPQQFRGFFRH
jgi:phosphoribosylaminoimidazolecarboxamide formyltransferase/IMP cyclohydrolase